ncbi:MAG: hypothetical protein RL417_1655 [Pseudomonadota bacterium]|jgi:hypothetical protein
MVTTALLMPVVLAGFVILFDLSRLYVNGIFAQEVALLAAKIASSSDPDGYAMPDEQVINLVRGTPAEGTQPGMDIDRRMDFWRYQLDVTKRPYIGKPYFTPKEKKVLNLAYGFMAELNPRIYFPIPVTLQSEADIALLGGKPNCSIYFRYATPLGAPPDPQGDQTATASYYNQEHDRIFYVDCAVPLIALSLDGVFTGPAYRIVSRNAYAYRSGNIHREGT